MYSSINANLAAILANISADHVATYDWLVENTHGTAVAGAEYQRVYGKYWRMNGAGLGPAWRTAYFGELQKAIGAAPAIDVLVKTLNGVPANAVGQQKLHFSFATKLLHMVSKNLPIYDSLVASFFAYKPPGPAASLHARVASLVDFHNFLDQEYGRILAGHLLAPAIAQFRAHFTPRQFTDQKVIDSLIWSWESLRQNGRLYNTPLIAYS